MMALIEDDNELPQELPGDNGLTVDLISAHPRKNPYFVGHKDGEAKFLKAWNSDYFHPVHLISGAAGIGKATFAYRIARYILNQESGNSLLSNDDVTQNPAHSLDCDFDSAISRQIAGKAHINMMVLEPGLPKIKKKKKKKKKEEEEKEEKETEKAKTEVNTGIAVEWVRILIERAHQTAANDGWRIYIIDKADEMSDEAVNAMLKILEEPPPKSLFLIVCDSPHKLPAPFRSRCQEIHLNPLSVKEVHDFLKLADIDPDPLVTESLAQLSDGGIGRALVWWRISALAIYDDLMACLQASLDGNPSPDDLVALAEKVATRDKAEQEQKKDKEEQEQLPQNIGHSFNAFSTMVSDYLAKAIFAFTTGTAPERVRPHIDTGIIEHLMQTSPDVENWLNLRSIVQIAAARTAKPKWLEKQQTVLEILWRLRYACQADWSTALKRFD